MSSGMDDRIPLVSETDRAAVVAALRRGEGVRRDLPGGGRLVFDRPVPFLCLYRRPGPEADPATEGLIASQSAWLSLPPQADPAGVASLLDDIAAVLTARFGAFLLLEMWLRPPGGEEEKPPHVFRIVAPSHAPPVAVLEEMEEALLACTIHRRTPTICVDYQETVHAPADPPWPCCRREGVTCLGLEISPVYRDPHSGEVYVFAWEAFRRRLNTALKRSFHAFAQHCTSWQPAHFHELGPQTPDAEALKVDRGLARISAAFDLLLHVTPVNSDAAWEAFRRSGFERPPEFLYRPRTVAPGRIKRRLFRLPLERIEDPTLVRILLAKRDELDRQITLLADRNTPRFLPGSRALFGDVEPELAALADELLAGIDHDGRPAEAEWLDAEAFANRAREELAWYRRRDRRLRSGVEVREDIAGILVSHGRFLIGRSARVSRSRVAAALAHEIGTHVLTWHNGRHQPFRELQEGMAGYEPLQEGLAVLAEYLVGGLEAARLRQLAGRVKAVQLICEGADFVTTFRTLHREYGFGARSAWMMTMRTFRGGGYTKDAVYLRGLQRLLQRLAEGVDLAGLYVGKLADAWLPYVEELRWRTIVQPPAILPRFFELPEATPRLRRLTAGLRVPQLLEDP